MENIKGQFPSLKRQINGNPVVYLDGPGGTQVPSKVINAIGNYYRRSNSNTHGAFAASVETDGVLHKVRQAIADLLGAEEPGCISIGQNMTSLAYSLSRGFFRLFQPGDEVVITQLDHEANRGPWLTLRQKGVVVREVKLLDDGTLDYRDMENKINERTRLVAVGWASNALGTVNDIARVRELSYKANAWMLVDAVHYAPHFSIDVKELGCDFLLCSSYKFYGPHMGFLYSRPGALDQVPTDRLVTTDQHAPYSIETGTLNHAALAGSLAAVEFIAALGEGPTRRDQLVTAYGKIGIHEKRLAERLYKGLQQIDDVKIIGQAFGEHERAPTISFTHKRFSPWDICEKLGDSGIYAWDGHFYALRAIQVLGLLERGGVTRCGISIYNTTEDIDRTLEIISSM